MNFVVVGFGSMGRRHAKTLRSCGHDVCVVDPALDPVHPVDGMMVFPSLKQALEIQDVRGVIICSPPEDHFPQSMMVLQANIACFVEKPVAMNADDAEAICRTAGQRHLPLAVGYQLRLTAGIQRVCASLKGEVLQAVRISYGWDIRRWHSKPQYVPRIGVLLEASHELDLLCWLFGTPQQIMASRSSHPDFGEAECTVDIIATLRNALPATIHLDYMRPEYERYMDIAINDRVVRWVFDADENEEAYQEEIKQFCHAVDVNDPAQVAVSGWEGLRVLQLIDLIKRQTMH